MTPTDLRALAESFTLWCEAFNVALYPWQVDAFGAATQREGGLFVHRLGAISVPRGNGKSFAASAVAAWRLVSGPAPQLVVSCALDVEGAKISLRHGRSILRGHPALEASAEFLSDEIRIPSTGSRWLVKSRDHLNSRGLHADIVLLDEADWSGTDELFSSLLAGQASCPDPLLLITSTIARANGLLSRIRSLAEEEAAEGVPA